MPCRPYTMSNKLWEKDFEVNKEIERFTVGKDREMDLFWRLTTC